MIEIRGKYNEAKIFADVVDSASIAQVQELCNQEFTAGSRIRLMPDIHAGAGCTIGTTMTIADKVVPNLVGVDIGCGMETVRIREGRLELQKLDKLIQEKIPSGFAIRDSAHPYLSQIDLTELCCARHVDLLRAERSIGTLGGGNHFIEVDRDDDGNLYLVVHSGSRHLGVEVASHYQQAGYKALNRADDASVEALVARMKAEGREKEIPKEIKRLKNVRQTRIPKALAYVSGDLFAQYIHDMRIVQRFAMLNRQAMVDVIVKGMKLHVEEQFSTIHNYIDTDARILRKGAVSAKAGERLLIPINMRDGSLLCVGKGETPVKLFSASLEYGGPDNYSFCLLTDAGNLYWYDWKKDDNEALEEIQLVARDVVAAEPCSHAEAWFLSPECDNLLKFYDSEERVTAFRLSEKPVELTAVTSAYTDERLSEPHEVFVFGAEEGVPVVFVLEQGDTIRDYWGGE